MKHFFNSFLICLLFSSAMFGQSAYYDAIKLKTYLLPSGKFDPSEAAVKEYAAILNTHSYSSYEDASEVIQLYKLNPFMSVFFEPSANVAGGTSMSMKNVTSSLAKKAGGMDVTNFADGMAKFLVDRAKQELNIAFFERFRTLLKDSTDLQFLFPKTHNTLQIMGTEIYNFQIYLNVLREAFESDLSNIILNSRRFVENAKALVNLRKDVKVYAAIRVAFDLAGSIQSGEHPGEAVALLASKPYVAEIDSGFYKSLKIYSIFSNSLRSIEEDRYWISQDELRELQDPTLLRIYLGLIYESIPEDLGVGNINYRKDILEPYATNVVRYYPLLKGMLTKFKTIENSVTELKQKGKEATGMDYYEMYTEILDFVEYVYINFSGTKIVPVEGYTKFKSYAKLTEEIYLSTYQKKYSMTIMNSVALIDSLVKNKNFSAIVFKYGSFMAAVVEAENSDQVKQAIEAVALPSGSSRIKRESLWNISLNAYLGGYGGAEYIQKLQRDNLKGSVGLSAPIGIAFSRGSKFLRGDKTKGGWSYTAFLSFIDLGAVAAFRIKDSTTAALPQLKLENILAPGVYMIAGIPRTPLSLGMFCQYGPSLRSVSTQNISVSSYNETTWRFGGMLAVDIPLLNLYNKGR